MNILIAILQFAVQQDVCRPIFENHPNARNPTMWSFHFLTKIKAIYKKNYLIEYSFYEKEKTFVYVIKFFSIVFELFCFDLMIF